MIEYMLKENLKVLREGKIKDNKYIVYWMQAAHRVQDNPALDFAIKRANDIEVPLVVVFNLTDKFPEANLRHYYFMLEGLKEVNNDLTDLGIKFILKIGDPVKNLAEISKDAVMLVSDRGYLKVERAWKQEVAEKINCRFVLVNTNTIVPVDVASPKEEYAAYTIRKKINNKVERFVDTIDKERLKLNSLRIKIQGEDLTDIDALLAKLAIDNSVQVSPIFKGGSSEALARLETFMDKSLEKYEEVGSNPEYDVTSKLSPYLHFGQISPAYIYKRIKWNDIKAEDFLEQLIVRRELSFNYVYYNENYDQNLVDILPNWAVLTLQEHKNDQREYNYSKEQFENYNTHDEYWNAAQKEMVLSGYMNGYMRMYWGKKILEWTKRPQKAFDIILYLNNKYFLDGRDPNGYAGAAWIFGKHDRAWKERKIFGKVRYMNKNGLKRKFDMEKYLKKVYKLT
ncbi:MAG TPA: deoxyribodipyrimidine photo-lyase [Halanaerobiales bacterium]|nr:deoxyribodipyrimidine photo-lyase [Halanaerobiales bacterium]